MNTIQLPNSSEVDYTYVKNKILKQKNYLKNHPSEEKVEVTIKDKTGSGMGIIMTEQNTQDEEDIHNMISMLYFLVKNLKEGEDDVVTVSCLAFGVYIYHGEKPDNMMNFEGAKETENIRMKDRPERLAPEKLSELERLSFNPDNKKSGLDVKEEEEGEEYQELHLPNDKKNTDAKQTIKILKIMIVIICVFILLSIFV